MVLQGIDFFPCGKASIAIEPRLPQGTFPEHHHDFYEIVIVEHGTGIHIFNDHPYTLSGGSVCFVRAHDRHLFEHTENLCLTNVLYRAPDAFCFLSGLDKLLPQEHEGCYPAHCRINPSELQHIKPLINQLKFLPENADAHSIARREILFMQLLVLIHQANVADNADDVNGRLNHLMTWLEDHCDDDICWEQLADRFSLSLRTLHRQVKQLTGLTPQRYLNRLRLTKARHLLLYTEKSVTDIAFQCGFGDSNHFSTVFKREFTYSPSIIRQGHHV